MRLTATILLCSLTSVLVTGCQTAAPTTATEVAARTHVIPGDGFGRTTLSVIGPEVQVTGDTGPVVTAHLAVADADEIWMVCYATFHRVPPNVMQSVFTSDREELPLVRLTHDLAPGFQLGVDRFTIIFSKRQLESKRAIGLKFKLYGTQAEVEAEIPAWYLEGFLQVAH